MWHGYFLERDKLVGWLKWDKQWERKSQHLCWKMPVGWTWESKWTMFSVLFIICIFKKKIMGEKISDVLLLVFSWDLFSTVWKKTLSLPSFFLPVLVIIGWCKEKEPEALLCGIPQDFTLSLLATIWNCWGKPPFNAGQGIICLSKMFNMSLCLGLTKWNYQDCPRIQ